MIRLTGHVEIRAIERDIAQEWIEAAVTTPDWTTADPDPALTRSYKAISALANRVLPVVHRRDGPDILVVTAHFDRSARR